MAQAEKLYNAGYDDVITFEGDSYDDALVGVTDDGRAVYDYDKMVAWLVKKEGCGYEKAMEWIAYNAMCALQNAGPRGPVIMYSI
jgi:hypothetical protein